MNNKKQQVLYTLLLIASIFMVSCVMQRKPDGTIDACKLIEPPINTHAGELIHVGNIFIQTPQKPSVIIRGA